VPLSTQEYKWVPANCWGNLTERWEYPAMDLHPIQGGGAIPLILPATETGVKKGELCTS